VKVARREEGSAQRPGLATDAVDYRTLADLRYQIRKFLRVREQAARRVGVAPQQYLVLLQVKGLAGQVPVTIGALAERLQLEHHSTVGLVDRLEGRGMVTRRRQKDRRHVVIALTPRGDALLRQLAVYSLQELQVAGPELVRTVTQLVRGAGRRPPRPVQARA
jgi:DNA-binding MarR family transcriptional regulator